MKFERNKKETAVPGLEGKELSIIPCASEIKGGSFLVKNKEGEKKRWGAEGKYQTLFLSTTRTFGLGNFGWGKKREDNTKKTKEKNNFDGSLQLISRKKKEKKINEWGTKRSQEPVYRLWRNWGKNYKKRDTNSLMKELEKRGVTSA